MSNGTDNFPVMPPYHSKEERDRMTTNTTSTASQAPAVSIADDDEFIDLMHALSSVPSSVYAGNEFSKVINYIDAKLAQSAEALHGQNELLRLELDDVRAALARERTSQTAAEAKLEAIRQGVERLARCDADSGKGDGVWEVADGDYLDRAEVLALLQPQHQADTSGLPG